METDFWHERWQRGEIGFHQPHIHDQLQRFWPALGLGAGSSVFVPLSGKSRDMVWLAERGHKVIGVELSELAVAAFFEEMGIAPQRQQAGALEVWSGGPYTIHCGDFFKFEADAVADVSAVYDRAALIALPPNMRPAYVTHLANILPRAAKVLLIALDYPEGEIAGPPFAVARDEVTRLCAPAFDIEVLEDRDGLAASENLRKRGVTRLVETAYLLRRRA